MGPVNLNPSEHLKNGSLGIQKFLIGESWFILTGPGGSQPFANPFATPDLIAKLEANPKTREFLKQPDYRFMIELLQKNPGNLQ